MDRYKAIPETPKDFINDKRNATARPRRYLAGPYTGTVVGFTAYLDHSIEHLQMNQPVIFDKTLFNEGNSYNSQNGVFTCPLDGVYLFFFDLSTINVSQIVAKLVVNNINTVDAISDTISVNHEAQGSNLAILRLTKGSHVWVANYRWNNQSVKSSHYSHFATFSGLLIDGRMPATALPPFG